MNDSDQKINNIKWLGQMGVDYILTETPTPLLGKKTIKKDISDKPPTIVRGKDAASVASDPLSIARCLADKANSLPELKSNVMSFDGCRLKMTAKNTVFADGNPGAKVMLIGEAPGASEDAAGIPFCGESGKLLDNMLSTVGISRKENAYITNTIFWRPPANRTPTQDEIDVCRPFVEKHIALIAPKLIVLVGSTAATGLLGKHAGINKIRQEYFSYINKYLAMPIPMTAIFHPAYLLRQPIQKKTTWYDLIKIQQFIEENL